MSYQEYWERDDGEPWESVESLPTPPRTVSPPTPEPFPWESLESLPPPFDAEPNPSFAESKTNAARKMKEGWSFRNLGKEEGEEDEEDEDHEEQPKEEWIDTPLSPTTPRATTRPAAEDDVESVGYIEYIPFHRLPAPAQLSGRHPYPPCSTSPPWPYPGHLYPGPLMGTRRQGPVHGCNDHPPVIPLSMLVEQLGISTADRDPPRSRRGRQRPLSPLSPPPTKPERSDFDIEDVSYEVREEKLYAGDLEVHFPKVPPYLPPTVKKARSPLRGRWNYETTHTHTHTRRRIPGSYGHPAAPAIDPFREGQARLWPRDKYQNLISNHPNNPTCMPPARNIGTLMKEWEDQGLVMIIERRKRAKKNEERRVARYHAGKGDGKGKKQSVGCEDDVEEEDGVDEDEAPYYDERDAPEWRDEDEPHQRQRGRERLRRDPVDGHDIDDHNSIHYPPASPQAFNVKRIRDKAIKTLGNPKKAGNGKAPAPAPALGMDGEDTEGIYYGSDVDASSKPKKPDPYEAFKRTTGRQPRHFHKSRKNPDEVFERFVLDHRPLAEGEKEPTGKHRRRPMIDTVNLKTGKRTRRKIRGYDRLPRMIRVAAGVEGLGGLRPRRKREVEEDEGGDEGEGMQTARRKSNGGRREKKDGCVVM